MLHWKKFALFGKKNENSLLFSPTIPSISFNPAIMGTGEADFFKTSGWADRNGLLMASHSMDGINVNFRKSVSSYKSEEI